MDPLNLLPPEIILRIIDACPISALAALIRLTKSWHSFIDETHLEAIYSSPSKTFCPSSRRDLSVVSEFQSFDKYFEGATSWKDICKRQTLLSRSWDCKAPLTRESVVQVGNDAVWRFGVDWTRRLVISTSQRGGLNVTDLDTADLLWRLSNDDVRPFAHLEYENGIAVFDRAGNGLEVWTIGDDEPPRGTFRQTAILPHSCTIRGFQLASKTLCVVSTQGQGFAYDMSANPPRLKTDMQIERDAAGHLYQDSEIVMYCMGQRGYHIHDKQSGALLGVPDPRKCQTFYHIIHPDEPRYPFGFPVSSSQSSLSMDTFPPTNPKIEELSPIELRDGRLEDGVAEDRIELDDDEWGAGILSESTMVGISRGGRMFVLVDWRLALREPKSIKTNSYLV